jgi:regulator of replication initiation timing
MNLANEVSTMQSELESLRAENRVLKRQNEMLEFEKDQLTKALDKVSVERDGHMVAEGQLKALIDSAGNALISGLHRYHEAIAQRDEVRKTPLPVQEVAPQATPLPAFNKAAE